MIFCRKQIIKKAGVEAFLYSKHIIKFRGNVGSVKIEI